MTNPYLEELNSRKKGGPQTGASPSFNTATNPYLKELQDRKSTSLEQFGGDNQSYENDNSFGHTLHDFILYAGNAMAQDPSIDMLKRQGSGAKEMFSNISNDLGMAKDYYTKTPISQIAQDAKGFVKDGVSQALSFGPGSIASGLLKGFIEKPIEAITATVNDNGSARPATPQEQAQSMQATAGLVAQIGVFKSLKVGMLGALPEGEKALAALKPTNIGNIALSGSVKNGAKFIATDAAAGALSGGVQGAIGGIGQDNQHEQIFAGAITSLPLTLAMGVLGARGYVKEIGKAKSSYIATNIAKATQDLASVNSLRINPSDPISTLVSNVDALSNSDQLVHAAIKSKLDVGSGYVVEGVTPETGKKLENVISLTDKERPVEVDPTRSAQIDAGLESKKDGEYNPPKELNKARPKPNSTEVKFDSPIDKVAYLAGGKSRSSYVQGLVDDLSSQTGLTDEEITSHGKYIRSQQKKLFKQEKLVPRSQAEIDAYNNASIVNGQKAVAALPEGGSYKDNQGNVWIRKGNTVVGKIGEQDVTLPLDQNNTLMQLGRKTDDTPFYRPYQNLPVQEFKPNFGRDTGGPGLGDVKIHYGANGTMLFTPHNYKPEIISFFKQHGYIPGEIVSIGGVDNLISRGSNGEMIARELNTGLENDVTGADYLRRTNNSLTPEVVKSTEGTGVKSPTLSPEAVTNHLYKKFVDSYTESIDEYNKALKTATGPVADIKEPAFTDFLQKFFHENGLPETDFGSITSLFTRKLGDDLADLTLSDSEKALRNQIGVKWMRTADARELDHSEFLSNQALSNGLFYSAEGAGKYRIRMQDSGKTLGIAGSPEEALGIINKIRQTSGLDLDGGFTGIVPPGVANRGGLDSQYTPAQAGRLETRIDLSRMGGLVSHFAPVGRMLQSVDNLMTQAGKDSQFYPKFLELQDVLFKRRNMLASDPELKSLSSKGQVLMDYLSKIKSDRRLVVADNVDTMTIDQIKNNYLGRRMTAAEEVLADDMAKSGNVSQIKDLLYKTRLGNKQAGLGGASFMTDLLELGKLYPPEVLKQAVSFVQRTSSLGKDVASGEGIMRLAEALEDPSLAMDQAEHARANKITPQEAKAVEMIKDWYKQAAPVAGIDPKAQLQVYLPTIVRKIAGSFDGDLNMNTEFAHELSRLGITPRGELIRDPAQLVSKYFTAMVNHKSGFYDAVTEFKDGIDAEIGGMKGTTMEGSIKSFQDKMDKYTRQVYGYPDPSDALAKSMNEIASSMGLKTVNQNSVLNLMSLGLIAGRPALAVRDFYNIWGLAWASFGNEFTTKFLSDSVDPEYVQALKDKNIMPNSMAQSIIDQTTDEAALIKNNGWIRQWSNKGFKLSGQEFGYEHANAGIYKASMSMAEKYFEKVRTKELSKAEAFDKMGITGNYGSGMINQIDALLVKGRTDLAADLYAKANMRYLSHVYGFHNNPIGWNSGFGRLMSQYGSWSANASQTFLDQMSRGSKKQIAGKIARIGIWNQATVMAGTAVGLNLNSWMVSHPLSVWPATGPLINMGMDAAQEHNRGMDTMGIIMKHGAGFLPYGSAAKGWLNGLDELSNGNIGKAIGGIAGAPLDRSSE